MRRTWTTGEEALLRDLFGRKPIAEVCRRLGRSYRSVESHASGMGLTFDRRPELGEPFEQSLKELNAQGWTDKAIAAHWGTTVTTVGKYRRLMGLPRNSHHISRRPEMVKRVRRQLYEAGVETMGELRAMVESVDVFKAGWPAGLVRAQGRTLDLLETGPKTCRMIYLGLGRSPKYANKTPVLHDGTSIVKSLRDKKFVVCLGRNNGRIPTESRHAYLYALAPGFCRRNVGREAA